ncbi:hypothetical protein AAKU52_000462 [Pedobacter sp. CG_S7]|uniref:hypothetical protein n=1 Tax=Pedobacter sp. CG_S7 TaxID=3143930 RepID=UPI003394ED0C
MIKFLSKIAVITSISMCLSCSSSNNKPVFIHFSADSNAIILSDIDPVGLLQLKNNQPDSTTRMKWVTVSVDGKRISGKINITGENLVFTPNTPFQRGLSYLVSTPLNANFGGAKEIIKGKINYQLKPQQKILQR